MPEKPEKRVFCPECDATGETACLECDGVGDCGSCNGVLFVTCPLCTGDGTITESLAWGWKEAQEIRRTKE